MSQFGSYELEGELGRGATARIFLARHRQTRERVSLKIFHPRLFQDGQLSRRVHQEMQVSTNLAHDHIVRVREVLADTDPPALVMDYVEGENLETFQGRLPYVLPEVSALIAIDILKALEYAHGKGLIHRDLKPENVLVRNDGRVLVTDFGLAKVVDATLATHSNVLLGSIEYMSPEQARGDVLTPQSDLFSAAAILYYLVTGTRPFTRGTPLATLAAIKEEEPEAPQRCNPKLSADLARVITRGLDKDLSRRFSTAAEFREALETCLAKAGLTESSGFSLARWMAAPTEVTLEALRTASESLAASATEALAAGDFDYFLTQLAHLSLKAPQSAALARLGKQYETVRSRSRRARGLRVAGVGGALLLALGLVLLLKRHGPAIITPVSAPVASVPSTEEAKGAVRFEVAPGTKVLWDGVLVDPNKLLENQSVGEHRLELRRRGFSPIQTRVQVRAGEPTVIRAK